MIITTEVKRIKEIAIKENITLEDLEELRFLEIDLTQEQAFNLNYNKIKKDILNKLK